MNTNLWGNSLIRKQNKPIFERNLLDSNIDRVIDIFDINTKKFYTLEQLNNDHGSTLDFLAYCGLRAAIPTFWKTILRNSTLDTEIDQERQIELLGQKKSVSKAIYWTLIENNYQVKDTLRFLWQREVNIIIPEGDWCNLYPQFLSIIKPVKLRYFQYRVLTKTLTTNVMRNVWNKAIDKHCVFYKQKDEPIIHLLWECTIVQKLWRNLSKMCKYLLNVDCLFDLEMNEILTFPEIYGKVSYVVQLG